MKREYQSIVHLKKEKKTSLYFEVSIFVFIIGLVTFLANLQYNGSEGSPGWFTRCIIASAIIIITLLVFGIINAYRMSQKQFAFAIDSNDQGIWLNSGRQFRMIYIPFSMLEIECTPGMLNFKYQNAFYYTKNGKTRMLRPGNERLRMEAVDENELQNFAIRFNQLASKQRAIILANQDPEQSIFRFEPLIGRVLLFIGLIFIVGFNPTIDNYIGSVMTGDSSSTSVDDDDTKSNSNFKTQDLKFGRPYSTKEFNITINKAYRAKTDQGKKVVIFNVTVNGKKEDTTIDSYNFYITSDKKVLSDGEEYARTPLYATTISVGGKNKPVVNQLNDEDNYGSTELENGRSATFNIVLGLTDENKDNYLIYSNFGIDDDPDQYENKPGYMWKFNPQKLEVLQ